MRRARTRRSRPAGPRRSRPARRAAAAAGRFRREASRGNKLPNPSRGEIIDRGSSRGGSRGGRGSSTEDMRAATLPAVKSPSGFPGSTPPFEGGRPETAPSGTENRSSSPMSGWGFAEPKPPSDKGSSRLSGGRPASRSSLQSRDSSIASTVRPRHGDSRRKGFDQNPKGGYATLEELGPPMSLRQRNTRTAGVYGANPDPAAMRNTPRRSGSRSPGRGSGGLPSLREARDKWVGGGVGSREELEAALSSTQTQLMMAKQRIEVLEQQNAALRAAAAEAKTKAATAASGSSPPKVELQPKEKLKEAHQLQKDGLITEADYEAVKSKYMASQHGI